MACFESAQLELFLVEAIMPRGHRFPANSSSKRNDRRIAKNVNEMFCADCSLARSRLSRKILYVGPGRSPVRVGTSNPTHYPPPHFHRHNIYYEVICLPRCYIKETNTKLICYLAG